MLIGFHPKAHVALRRGHVIMYVVNLCCLSFNKGEVLRQSCLEGKYSCAK